MQLKTGIYLDSRAFTRHCVGGWLRRSLSGFRGSRLARSGSHRACVERVRVYITTSLASTVVVTNTTPRWEFYLLQKRDSPLAGSTRPGTRTGTGAG